MLISQVIWSSLPPQPPVGDLRLEDYSQGSSLDDEFFHCVPEDDFLDEKTDQDSQTANIERKFESLDLTNKTKTKKSTTTETCLDMKNEIESPLTELDYSEVELPNPLLRENSFNEELAITGDIDFQNPRSEKRTTDLKASNSDATLSDSLPPPEELGCGHPFLLFVCLAVLLHEREEIMSSKMEYDVMVMHFDKMVRKHSPKKVLSKAMKLFAEYLRSDLSSFSST